MWTDGVVLCSPRSEEAASLVKPVEQKFGEALLGKLIHWIDCLTSSFPQPAI
jgi:hypothetical protein